MATDAQKLKTRLMLGLPACALDDAVDALSAAELDELDTLLTAFDGVKLRAADVAVDGVTVKADKARRLIQDRAWALLGYPTGGAIRIGRA